MMLLNASLLRNGDNVWERVREGFELPEVNADIVNRQERFYASKPEYFKRMLDRSHKYLFHIMNEVERRGMPTEIALLPMVESSFVPSANSHVGASGLWQFMPSTGRQYGLEQTWWYDGRRDVLEATRAALDYLQNLYAQFGDWNLALAAYNWGEGNLSRAMAKATASGLLPTYENIRMPNETRNYAPKLLAIRNILQNPEKFGIKLDKFPNKPYFVAVSTGKHMDMSVAAKLADMSLTEFKELNPAYNLPVFAYKPGRQMLIPANRVEKFEANLDKWDKPLLTWTVFTPNSDQTASDIAQEHGMSTAELLAANNLRSTTLAAGRPVLVALKSSTAPDERLLDATDTGPAPSIPVMVAKATPAVISVANNSSDPAAILAGKLSQPVRPIQVAQVEPATVKNAPSAQPARLIEAKRQDSSATQVKPVLTASADESSYTIASGDTLYSISRRYNVSVTDLKSWNNLQDNTVKLGQVLKLKGNTDNDSTMLAANTPVPTPTPAAAATTTVVASSNTAQADALLKVSTIPATQSKPAEYIVKRGDTVFSIARRFGVNHTDIQRWNDASKLVNLQPGQRVIVQQAQAQGL